MVLFARALAILTVVGCLPLFAATKVPDHVQLNLEEGFQFRAKIVREWRCIAEIDPEVHFYFSRNSDMLGRRAVGFVCDVVEKSSDGDIRVRFQYEWIRDQSTMAGSYYSSDRNRNPNVTSTRDEHLDALVGRSFFARVTSLGEVRGIEGFADMCRRLRNALVTLPPMPGYGDREDARRRRREEWAEERFQRFFSGYWPLSEQKLKETVQEFFFVWPQEGIGPVGAWSTQDAVPSVALKKYNSWTLRTQTADANTVVVDLAAHVRTDLNLCDPNAVELDYGESWAFDGDDMARTCPRYSNGKHPPMYAGERKGSFTVNAKSGLIQHATWTEELRGIWPLTDPGKGGPAPAACPVTRTETVTIEITPTGN